MLGFLPCWEGSHCSPNFLSVSEFTQPLLMLLDLYLGPSFGQFSVSTSNVTSETELRVVLVGQLGHMVEGENLVLKDVISHTHMHVCRELIN